ncbi:MAG: class I SAM-dependent methyltransferase [Candidatus Hydrogenedentota bacterium]
MGELRDFDAEAAEIMKAVEMAPEQTLLELGAGTGWFALRAARHCQFVHACDVSKPMVEYARLRAEKEHITNIAFHCAGFLTYKHKGNPVDVVVSQLALHHIPDFWKAVALSRIDDVLKPGGMFWLKDVVFGFDLADYEHVFNEAHASYPPAFRDPWVGHVNREYSTQAWIMEGLLERAGFRIESRDEAPLLTVSYLCRKMA